MKTISALFISLAFSVCTLATELVVLDVRTPSEFNVGHVKRSINLDFKSSEFKKEVSKLDKNKEYKLYCRSGNRSGKALKIMQEMGFKHLENLGSLQEANKSLQGTCEGTC